MYRTVLVHAAGKESSARIALAVDVARQFGATLIGIAASLPQLPIEVYDVAIGTVAIGPDYAEFDRRHVEAEFGKAEAVFRQATAGAGLETSWRTAFEAPTDAIVAAAVAADLVVVGPGDHSLLGNVGLASAGDIALRTGRPLLVVPDRLNRLTPQNVLVAWKNTAEAQRALADAVPFMKRAGSVVVAAVHEGAGRPDSIDDAVAFLTRHAIPAKAVVIPAKGAAVEEAILDFARRAQVDLIVAGAYGHSRVREWIFGGVTRALIQKATVPFLLSH